MADSDINTGKDYYANSKLGVIFLGKLLKQKYGDHFDIKIVNPGYCDTNIFPKKRCIDRVHDFVRPYLSLSTEQGANVVMDAINDKTKYSKLTYNTPYSKPSVFFNYFPSATMPLTDVTGKLFCMFRGSKPNTEPFCPLVDNSHVYDNYMAYLNGICKF